MTFRPQVLGESVLQLEAGMVGSHVDAHAASVAARSATVRLECDISDGLASSWEDAGYARPQPDP
jgi:hypothetical protein